MYRRARPQALSPIRARRHIGDRPRLVAIGALVPDAIDKPLARFGVDALSYSETAGHTIGHTLVLALAVIIVGAVLARRGDARLLWIGLGILSHPLVDPVIVYPSALVWPLLGSDFPESKGIPSSYLRIFDAILVATFALAFVRSEALRNRAQRFVTKGELAGG